MAPERLDVLSTLKEITGFLNIQSHHDSFRNLGAFRNLEVIGGRTLTEYFASLYIVKTSLTSLGLRSLRKISSGSVAILENEELCYAGDINWTQIMRSQVHNTLLQNNRDPGKCIAGGAVCDKQCSSEGCWGPGNKMCLSCRTYNVDEECVPSCDPNLGLYEAGKEFIPTLNILGQTTLTSMIGVFHMSKSSKFANHFFLRLLKQFSLHV